MPVAGAIVVGSVVAGGASIIAGNKAAKASQSATDQTTALNRDMFQQQQQNNAPYLAAGSNALMALQGRGAGVAAPGAPGQAGTPQYDQWSAYLQAYPDVAAEAQRVTADGEFPSADAYAQWHFQKYGQAEGRQVPAAPPPEQPQAQSQPPPPTPIQAASAIDPNTNDFSALMGQTLAARPTAPARPDPAPRPEMVRPTVAPLDVSTNSYVQSPDYQFQLSEGNKNIIANKAAVGGLESGAALKAVQKYGQDVALGDYSQWRNYATGQYNTNRDVTNNNFAFDASRSDQNYQYDTGRKDQNFNVDRGYATDVYNTDRGYATDTYNNKTNDMFRLASLGQGAVGQSAAAGQTYAGNNANAVFSNAATQGNAALSTAGTISGTVNNGVSAYTSYLGRQDQNAMLKALTTPKAA